MARAWPRPVLILVDDADLRHDLPVLLDALHQVPGEHAQTVRAVLIAREFGAWWDHVQQPLRHSVDTAAQHTWVGPVAADIHGQRAATRRAITAFATRLDVAVDTDTAEVRGIQAGTPVLLLHAAALETVAELWFGPAQGSEATRSLLRPAPYSATTTRWPGMPSRFLLPAICRLSRSENYVATALCT